MAGAIALIALAACSSDSPTTAGSTTIPNATAEVSSSSNVTSSSSSDAIINGQDIVFTTTATAKKAIPQGEITIYGLENGAQASCSIGKNAKTKSYTAKISIINGNAMESTLSLRNFGDTCKDLLKSFKESCSSGVAYAAPDAECNQRGDLKIFCNASKTNSVRICNGSDDNCATAEADSTLNFNDIVDEFSRQAGAICESIADGFDTATYNPQTSNSDSSLEVIEDSLPTLPVAADVPVFQNLLAPFTANNEKVLQFDSHVIAYNTALSPSCENIMVSYDENEMIIPVKPISGEAIAECFPKTAPVLEENHLTEDEKTKFYAVITSMGESPQVLVLNKFTGEEINIYVVYPGNNCFLNATGPIVMYLVADTENTAINKNIIITGKELRSESWNCDEKGNFPDNVKPYGEWYRTDLAIYSSSTSNDSTINTGRKFIIAPNTENLEVSDEERAILDSLAKAFPQKSTTDQIDGMTRFINYDAQYHFTTQKERYTIPEEDNPYFCIVDVYQEESGLIRSFTPNSRGTLQATILLTPNNSIAYLAYGEVYSSVGPAKSLFKEECEATNGSFYDYYPNDGKVAVACAVKNFTGIPFETIVSEQQSLCDNDYKSF